jgi:hypothetical protein
MKYLCAQPAIKYYGWQLDAMLYNFRDIGIDLKDVIIVSSYKTPIDDYFSKLESKYEANFYYYPDTREEPMYISSIRPHVLAKHFEAFPELENEVIFYHDCDIVLMRPLELNAYLKDDITYLSDTVSYIGYEYIKSKGNEVVELMCNIVDICSCKVRANQHNSGGAQYLFKNINAEYWRNVEEDSEMLYYGVTQYNNKRKEKEPEYHELQIWCADMWAVLWNLWKLAKPTRIVKEMDFIWPTQKYEKLGSANILHNAGVINGKEGLFYKGDYMNELPKLDLKIDETKASAYYYDIVKKALS